MSIEKKEIEEYLTATKYVVLATVNEENTPALRVMGAFGVNGFSVYYSTKKDTAKVKQIDANPKVTVYFQHENQEPAKFINVSISGNAIQLSDQTDIDEAVRVISARSAKFRENVEKNGLADNVYLYRVDPGEVKILDRRNGAGPDSVSVIKFQ
jgi:general stress protein 26